MRRIEKRGEVNVLCDDYGCSPATKAEAEFFDEITRLRAEVASLTAQLQSGESFHAVAVHQRDAAWGEVETLKATLTQQCKGFRADVEKLEAEVEALKAENLRLDAAVLDWLYANGPNGWIEKLRVAVEDLTADRDSWRDQASARAADAVRFMQERDAARAEVEALKAKNEKLWRWYNTAEQALATERGRSFKSAADRWQKVVEKLQAEVVSREAAIAEALQIVRVYAARNPLHDYNGVMQDPHGAHAWLMRNDAARAAQGDKT